MYNYSALGGTAWARTRNGTGRRVWRTRASSAVAGRVAALYRTPAPHFAVASGANIRQNLFETIVAAAATSTML